MLSQHPLVKDCRRSFCIINPLLRLSIKSISPQRSPYNSSVSNELYGTLTAQLIAMCGMAGGTMRLEHIHHPYKPIFVVQKLLRETLKTNNKLKCSQYILKSPITFNLVTPVQMLHLFGLGRLQRKTRCWLDRKLCIRVSLIRVLRGHR